MRHPGFFNNVTINYGGQLVDPGRAIRRFRTRPEINMTQTELAKKAGLAPSYVSQIELNRCGSMKTYARLAKAMGTTTDAMFGI
jgi:transcriptional regulator with XRE-family HTH domain